VPSHRWRRAQANLRRERRNHRGFDALVMLLIAAIILLFLAFMYRHVFHGGPFL
jgi:predicted nucleic acid-binding Zn ribbon protein